MRDSISDEHDRDEVESSRLKAQRLESIGALAAGVAHELNTPIQYVTDSVRFMADAIDDLFELDRCRQAARDLLADSEEGAELLRIMDRKEVDLDLGFTRKELPGAVDRALSGLHRVSHIVRAMRSYSHPGEEVGLADINQVVETAVTLALHEYKYVADLELDLGDLPVVPCNRVQLSQVVVNLLINAAHAIEDRHAGGTGRGRIMVATEPDGEGVRIDVVDDGGGIPVAVRDRIFEPFFTTKPPGRGTGQGLALAYKTVVEGHGGRLTVEVDDGIGTTFHIWLPQEDDR